MNKSPIFIIHIDSKPISSNMIFNSLENACTGNPTTLK